MHDFDKAVQIYKGQLQAAKDHPLRNFRQIRSIKRQIQAIEEAGRDVFNTTITGRGSSVGGVVDKCNYQDYEKQVNKIYEMYDSRCDFGGELVQALIKTRVVFIAGEGISVITKKKKTRDFIDTLFKENKLYGSNLLLNVRTGEMEGKNLLILSKSKNLQGDDYVRVNQFRWFDNKYKIISKKDNNLEADTISYKLSDSDKEIEINLKTAVFVKLGGVQKDINICTNRIHTVITQLENFSRNEFDLVKNTHIFGKIMPFFKTPTSTDARIINNDLANRSWEIGDGYAGVADFSLNEPTGDAGNQVVATALLLLKICSVVTGIPIHWLGFPELMSNRATADNLFETIKAATCEDRLIWEEAYTELINKAMIYAVNKGIADNSIISDFTVKLPIVSYALLQQIADIWIPLWQDKIISKADLQNMLPGIDPDKTNKQIKNEEEEEAKNSPINNKTVDEALKNAQDNANPNKDPIEEEI